MKISGPGPHTLGLQHNGVPLIVDNSDPNFGQISLDPTIWTLLDPASGQPAWQVPVIKRIWNRFGPLYINCPSGTAPNGLPYRIDEFHTRIILTIPMADCGLFLMDGRMWTTGKNWGLPRDSHRTNAIPSYQMTETDKNATIKCSPSGIPASSGGPQNMMVVLPPFRQVTGTQLSDGSPSYHGCTFYIKNVDPPTSSYIVTVFPYSGESLDNYPNGLILKGGQSAGLYMSGDGTLVI